MPYYRLDSKNIVRNFLKTNPESNFHLFETSSSQIRLIYNNQKNPVINDEHAATYNLDGTDPYHPPNVSHVPYGFIELYGQNVARPFNSSTSKPDFIHPFITKDSGLQSMASVSTGQFNSDFSYGDRIDGLGVRGATISSQLVSSGVHVPPRNSLAESSDEDKRYRDALRTTFNHYTRFSPRFIYEKGLEGLDASSPSWQDESFRLIQIPQIFYGEKIKKGSLKLDWYSNGELVGTLEDTKQNGELLVSYSKNASEVGKFVGLVFYGEGFIILTNRSSIHTSSDPRSDEKTGAEAGQPVTWIDFMEPLEEYTIENIDLNAPDYPLWSMGASNAYVDISPYTILSIDSIEMSVVLQPNGEGSSMPSDINIPFSGITHFNGQDDVGIFTPYYQVRLVSETTNKYLIKLYEVTFALMANGNRVLSRTEIPDPSGLILNTTLDENGQEVIPPVEDQVIAKDVILSILQGFNGNLSSVQLINTKYSFNLYFQGQHTIPTMLMMVNLEKSEASHSNNPTFLDVDRQYVKVETALVQSSVAREHFILTPQAPVAGQIQTIRFKLDKAHNLGDAGEFFPITVNNVLDSNGVDPFAGLRLFCKTLDDKFQLEVYRVLSDGSYEPITTTNTITVTEYDPVTRQLQESQKFGYEITNSTSIKILKSSYERNVPFAGKYAYFENPGFKIKNTVKSKYKDPYAEYKDQTYISKIGLYDEDRNLIAIAKLATPVKKTPNRDFTFKLKLDL